MIDQSPADRLSQAHTGRCGSPRGDDKKTRRLQRYAIVDSCDGETGEILGSSEKPRPDGAYCHAEDVARLEDDYAEAIKLLRDAQPGVGIQIDSAYAPQYWWDQRAAALEKAEGRQETGRSPMSDERRQETDTDHQ